MKINIPKRHDFPDSLKRKVLDKTGGTVPNWEISVQRKDDLAWSIVLSFLLSANLREDSDDFEDRLKALTGNSENLDLVKRAITIFNPFRNRYSCFYNKILKQIVTEFQRNLDWDTLRSVPAKLSAVSKRLECPLLLLWKDKDSVQHRFFSETAEGKFGIIALHSIEHTNKGNSRTTTVCNFLLANELGVRLKIASLRYFLKEAKIPRKISKKVESVVEEGEHFLISLLYSDHQDVISILYDSAYLVSKLKEAGFETDPSSRDSGGFSALHHALAQGKTEILYKLYYFSANNCCQTEGSFRDPDSSIVSNLQKLEEILSDDFAKFEVFKRHPKYEIIKKEYGSLLRFNKFLVELSGEILKIKSKLNYYETKDDVMFEAFKRRDVILRILDTYMKFFRAVPLGSDIEFHLDKIFDDYIEYINYYKSIDVATAIVFFSNIIFLKERLVLACENQYSRIEISFHETILHNRYSFYNIPFDDLKDISAIYFSNNEFLQIPLIKRLDHLEKVSNFSQNLRDTIITKDNVLKCIPKEEILSIFNSFPIFKNMIHLDRLKYYLDTALRTKVVDEKSVLVLQRVLQVIGEYVHITNDNDNSFRRFLLLALPKEACRILLRVRNELSHLKNYVCKVKFECEKNFSLFRSIQKEIGLINRPFSLVYNFYKCNETLQCLKMLMKEIKEIKMLKLLYGGPDHYLPNIEEMEEDYFIHLQRNTFLRNGILYKKMFEITLNGIEDDIEKEVKWVGDKDQLKNQILCVLWPLKYLTELLVENDSNTIIKVLDILETMNTCEENVEPSKDLQIKTGKFIKKCKQLLEYLDCKYTSKRRKKKSFESIHIGHIEHFLKMLKGFTYLSNEQKEEIRKEIPEKVKLDIITVKELEESAREGFTLNIDEKDSKFQISYISKKKLRKIFAFYNKKSLDVISELAITDPISELEQIFSNNSVNKKKFDSLCEIMQFSDKTKKQLENLVAGQRKKIPEIDLRNLQNRIKWLKKILIEDNEEIQNLWQKVKRQTSKKHVSDRIVWYYVRDPALQTSVEMLLLDCMSIFESQKGGLENPWIKSSNLYCGINLRNIISHGNPFLDSLCDLLAPDDLASDVIQKAVRLIEGEDAVDAILDLYERLGEDYTQLHKTINDEDEDGYSELKNRILKCDDWKMYSLLLPYWQSQSEN